MWQQHSGHFTFSLRLGQNKTVRFRLAGNVTRKEMKNIYKMFIEGLNKEVTCSIQALTG
jgi:hypothetical protein